jgi:hypothetical protein
MSSSQPLFCAAISFGLSERKLFLSQPQPVRRVVHDQQVNLRQQAVSQAVANLQARGYSSSPGCTRALRSVRPGRTELGASTGPNTPTGRSFGAKSPLGRHALSRKIPSLRGRSRMLKTPEGGISLLLLRSNPGSCWPRAGPRTSGPRSAVLSPRLVAAARQLAEEAGALALTALHPDVAAVQLHNLPGNEEAQARGRFALQAGAARRVAGRTG